MQTAHPLLYLHPALDAAQDLHVLQVVRPARSFLAGDEVFEADYGYRDAVEFADFGALPSGGEVETEGIGVVVSGVATDGLAAPGPSQPAQRFPGRTQSSRLGGG